jgi:hypothetical protein
VIPSTFTLTGARTVTYDDGVRALILDGITHAAGLICSDCKGSGWSAGDLCGGCGAAGFISPPGDEPVSVTVFLGRGDDMVRQIIEALGGAA